MITSKEIRDKSEISHGDGNFQTIILKILADIMERLETISN